MEHIPVVPIISDPAMLPEEVQPVKKDLPQSNITKAYNYMFENKLVIIVIIVVIIIGLIALWLRRGKVEPQPPVSKIKPPAMQKTQTATQPQVKSQVKPQEPTQEPPEELPQETPQELPQESPQEPPQELDYTGFNEEIEKESAEREQDTAKITEVIEPLQPRTRCNANKLDGTQCGAKALTGVTYCGKHKPK